MKRLREPRVRSRRRARNGERPSSVTPPCDRGRDAERRRTSRRCMRSAPTAVGTSGGTSAKRTATGIAPKSAAETSARRTASIYGAARAGDQAPQRRRGRGLREQDPGEHDRAARPAGPAEPLGEEHDAEERRERRLEGEDERRARGGRPRLHPRRDEVAERAGEDPGDDERVPGLRVGRRLDLSGGERDGREPDARDAHLEERQRAGVVTRREPLHRHDLERLRDGVREHEQVPERRPSRRAVEQREPGHRERDADPRERPARASRRAPAPGWA